MANIRTPHRRAFVALSNKLLQDKELSFECRGMLAYLLSKPADWEARPSDIEHEGGIGREARRRIMKEAEAAGYLTFNSDRNNKGQIVCWYDAHETPVDKAERTQSWATGKAKPGTGFPQAGESEPGTALPQAAEPLAGGPAPGGPAGGEAVPLIKKEVENTDLKSTEENKSSASAEVGHSPAFDQRQISTPAFASESAQAEPKALAAGQTKGKGKQAQPRQRTPQQTDAYCDAFSLRFAARWAGLEYHATSRDFAAFKLARQTYGDKFTLDAWNRACTHYFQSPLANHTIHGLISNFPGFLSGPLDRFNRTKEVTNESNKQVDGKQKPVWRNSRVRLGE